MPQQIIPLTDDELLSIADDQQLQAKLTREERGRLNRLLAQEPGSVDIQATLEALGPMKPVPSHGEPTTAENIRNMLQWGGKTIGGAFFGPAGVDAVENPGFTLASAAVPLGAGHAWTVARDAYAKAAPALKTEAATRALRLLGVPRFAASRIVGMLSSGAKTAPPEPVVPTESPTAHMPSNATGTQWGHVQPASATSPSAVRASPAESTPAVPASPVASGVPQSGPTPPVGPRLSPQQIRNEVGLAEKRVGVMLTEAQREQADYLVAHGVDPKTAVQSIAGRAPEASVPMPTAAPAPPAAVAQRPRLTAAEMNVFRHLLSAGKTQEEAYASIELQRGLAARLGTPSPEQVRQAVAERNATGRWKPDTRKK